MIPATLLADLRAMAEAMLGHTATITRAGSPTLGAAGKETVTYSTVQTGVPCLLRPPGIQAGVSVTAGTSITEADWIVRLPAGTDVRVGDRLATNVDGETKTLEVLPPVGGPSYELLRTVSCSEIT